jgi:ATP-dependent RNA helicase DHX57
VSVRHPQAVYAETANGNIAKANDAKSLRYFTQREGRVFLHPRTVNFTEGHYESPWLVYHSLVSTTKLFVQDTSMIHPKGLLLFGGTMEVLHDKKQILMDNWIRFRAPAQIAVLIREMRKALDVVLQEMIVRPECCSESATNPVVEAITQMLVNE